MLVNSKCTSTSRTFICTTHYALISWWNFRASKSSSHFIASRIWFSPSLHPLVTTKARAIQCSSVIQALHCSKKIAFTGQLKELHETEIRAMDFLTIVFRFLRLYFNTDFQFHSNQCKFGWKIDVWRFMEKMCSAYPVITHSYYPASEWRSTHIEQSSDAGVERGDISMTICQNAKNLKKQISSYIEKWYVHFLVLNPNLKSDFPNSVSIFR